MKPFRFGVNLRTAASGAAWLDTARRVEDLGYATLTVPDHIADMFSPLPAIAAAAAATRHLRVGTMVLNNDFRHPALLAREAALIDVLSDGRLQLGLGAGYMKSEYEQAGLPFDRGGVRVERLAESVTILKAMLRGEAVTFAGRHYRVNTQPIHPIPRRPLPILIGGNGPRLLALAAREADIVALTGLTFTRGGTGRDFAGFAGAGVDERLRWIREAAGGRFEALELSALVQSVVITPDRARAAEEFAATRPGLTADVILASPFMLLGTREEIVDQLRQRRERWGLSYYVVMEPALEPFAPVVATLSGH